MRYISMIVALLLAVTAHAQTPDSLRTEVTTGTEFVAPVDTSERAVAEREKLKLFFRKSRKETTMFQVGLCEPSYLAFLGHRALRDRYPGFGGFWLGVNHKITPVFGVRGGAVWFPAGWNYTGQYSSNDNKWLGLLAVDYYPFIRKGIREGKTAHNFYDNPYITLETWQPLNHPTTKERATGVIYPMIPFRRSVALGIGVVGNRTRIYFYKVSLSLAYWIDRSTSVQHPFQPMLSWSGGFGF